jgi:tRNA pseudouridine55 synthase
MAKGSYLQKHKASIAGTEEEHQHKKLPQVQVSDEGRKTFEEGKVILVDKPLHWTSFDVVRKIRNSIKIKKVGHAGTLDPLATGLLIVCTGKFTKKINEYMAQKKEYTGSFTLGATTPTYDKESAAQDFKDFKHITNDEIVAATKKFFGEIQQYPPIYSAIKKNGVASYELARRGEEVELKSRTITIKEFEITKIELPTVEFRILCGTGTYIRSLAHDMGQALGCGAYLSELRRTKIGECNVDDANTMEGFLEGLKDIEQSPTFPEVRL